MLTGDPSATDPVCSRSPQRHAVDEVIDQTRHAAATRQPGPAGPQDRQALVFRTDANSRAATSV